MYFKNKYLDFYKENFGQGKYCSKSWGLASYEAGQQSKQAEIDALKEKLKKLQVVYDDCTEYTAISELLDSIKELLK